MAVARRRWIRRPITPHRCRAPMEPRQTWNRSRARALPAPAERRATARTRRLAAHSGQAAADRRPGARRSGAGSSGRPPAELQAALARSAPRPRQLETELVGAEPVAAGQARPRDARAARAEADGGEGAVRHAGAGFLPRRRSPPPARARPERHRSRGSRCGEQSELARAPRCWRERRAPRPDARCARGPPSVARAAQNARHWYACRREPRNRRRCRTPRHPRPAAPAPAILRPNRARRRARGRW